MSNQRPDQTQGVTERDGIILSYVRIGNAEKPTLVLCHGLTDNGLCWQRTADALASDFDILMLDARNHGHSGDGPASAHELAADIAHVIDHLGISNVSVIGHSVGAATAAAFAGDFPNRVHKVVLEDPPWRSKESKPDPDTAAKQSAGFAKYIESLQSKNEADIVSFGKNQHTNWHDDDFPAWAASKKQVRPHALEAMELGQWREVIPKITCPTLLVYGEQENGCDGIVTAEVADKIVAMNPHIESCLIPKAGHNLRREQFEPFIKAVSTFLASQ